MNRHAPEIDLVLFDFLAVHTEDADQAIGDLLYLVSDPQTCRQRVAWLRKVRTLLPAGSLPVLRPYSDLVRFPENLFALTGTPLTPEQIAELHQLSCDPDGLWTVHLALTGQTRPPPPQPHSTDGTTEWTRMALDANAALKIVAALAEYAVGWLGLYGLAADLKDAFLDFVPTKLPIAAGSRFRDAWPLWLEEFARAHHAGRTFTAQDLYREVPRLAVQRVLENFAAGQTTWRKNLVVAVRSQLSPDAVNLDGVVLDATRIGIDKRTVTEARRELDSDITTEQFRIRRVHDLID